MRLSAKETLSRSSRSNEGYPDSIPLHETRIRVENKGFRTPMIAYNLVRQVMCEAASEGGLEPWRISFKATMTTLTDMLPMLGMLRHPEILCAVLFACCQRHIVGNRPDRYEPRVLKRRPKPYKLMQKPRHHYKPGEP